MNRVYFNKMSLNVVSLNSAGVIKKPKTIQELWEEYVATGAVALRVDEMKANGISGFKVYGAPLTQLAEATMENPLPVSTNRGEIGTRDAELPRGYARLTGITMNDDTYYTISGFRLKGSDTVKISFSADKACNVFGCYTTTTAEDNYSIYATTTAGGKYTRYNGGTYLSSVEVGVRYDIVMSPTGCTGFATPSTWTKKTFEASVDMLVGTTSEAATSSKLAGTIYGAIEVVGRLKLIPCKRLSDGVVGYYDTYSSTFYAPTVGSPVAGDIDTTYVSEHNDGADVVKVYGKNLSYGELIGKGYASTGAVSTSATFCGNLHKIAVSGGQKYTVSWGNLPDGLSGVFVNTWKTDGTWNARQAISATDKLTYIIPEGIGEVNFTLYKTGGITIGEDTWVQVELGADATEHEDYREPVEVLVSSTLLGEGDYHDLIGGEVYKMYGYHIFKGNESLGKSTAYGNAIYMNGAAAESKWNADIGMAPVCSHFVGSSVASSSNAAGTCFFNASGHFYFRMDEYTDAASFKVWLKEQYAGGQPVVVVYGLKNPATSSAEPMTVENAGGTSTFFRDCLGMMEVTCKVKPEE